MQYHWQPISPLPSYTFSWISEPSMSLTELPFLSMRLLNNSALTVTGLQFSTPFWLHCTIEYLSLVLSSVKRYSSGIIIVLTICRKHKWRGDTFYIFYCTQWIVSSFLIIKFYSFIQPEMYSKWNTVMYVASCMFFLLYLFLLFISTRKKQHNKKISKTLLILHNDFHANFHFIASILVLSLFECFGNMRWNSS